MRKQSSPHITCKIPMVILMTSPHPLLQPHRTRRTPPPHLHPLRRAPAGRSPRSAERPPTGGAVAPGGGLQLPGGLGGQSPLTIIILVLVVLCGMPDLHSLRWRRLATRSSTPPRNSRRRLPLQLPEPHPTARPTSARVPPPRKPPAGSRRQPTTSGTPGPSCSTRTPTIRSSSRTSTST